MRARLLGQAERRLAEEVERVKHYLDASTEAKITRVVENELIREQVRRGPGRRGGVRAAACTPAHGNFLTEFGEKSVLTAPATCAPPLRR